MKIAELVATSVAQSYSAEAFELVSERIQEFDRRLIRKLDERELLPALAEPAIQVLLRKAQLGAASSGREGDYERLAELLGSRASEDNRRKRAAIDQAVGVVDLVDDSALLGLTLTRYVQLIGVWNGPLADALDQYDKFTGYLVQHEELPTGDEWVEHLHSLGLVRISQTEKFSPFREVLTTAFDGYVCRGMAATDADLHSVFRREVAESGGGPVGLVPHELKEGFVRPAYGSTGAVDRHELLGSHEIGDVEAYKGVLSRFMGLGAVERELVPSFMDLAQQRPFLKQAALWWDSITLAFRLTGAGTVLAAADSKRHIAEGMRA
jgi:hypothetical protein